MEYRYRAFGRRVLKEEATFAGGPVPGSRFPDFDLPTARGGRMRLADLAGEPFVMIFGSFT